MNKLLLFGCWLLISSSQIFANSIAVGLNLTSISANKLSEKSGDEIYITVTEYPDNNKPTMYRIPEEPKYWLSKNLNKLQDLNLAQINLADNASIQLVVSIIEHDAPPLNADDHIGSVKLSLKNDAGKLYANWGFPEYVDLPEQEKLSENEYLLKGANSEYKVNFKLISSS